MAVTTLEIIDTAVKVGLGAIITGVLGYIVAVTNHKKEVHKEALKRRRELLEEAAKDVGEVWKLYRGIYDDAARKLDLFPPVVDDVKRRVSALEVVDTRLLLLGELKARQELEQFTYLVNRLLSALPLVRMGTEVLGFHLLSDHEMALEHRNAFFMELSASYMKVTIDVPSRRSWRRLVKRRSKV